MSCFKLGLEELISPKLKNQDFLLKIYPLIEDELNRINKLYASLENAHNNFLSSIKDTAIQDKVKNTDLAVFFKEVTIIIKKMLVSHVRKCIYPNTETLKKLRVDIFKICIKIYQEDLDAIKNKKDFAFRWAKYKPKFIDYNQTKY